MTHRNALKSNPRTVAPSPNVNLHGAMWVEFFRLNFKVPVGKNSGLPTTVWVAVHRGCYELPSKDTVAIGISKLHPTPTLVWDVRLWNEQERMNFHVNYQGLRQIGHEDTLHYIRFAQPLGRWQCLPSSLWSRCRSIFSPNMGCQGCLNVADGDATASPLQVSRGFMLERMVKPMVELNRLNVEYKAHDGSVILTYIHITCICVNRFHSWRFIWYFSVL